ncbi:MAG: YfcC family protein [Anaerolineaceae bacterium]|nr:YfcC family protein [Anaerolineaceae bacterium]
MDEKAGAQISRKAFIQTFIILLLIITFAGILTRVVPAGSYDRVEQNGQMVIAPTTYHQLASNPLPIWRWFTAPIEVLWGPDSLMIITIIIFILLVSGGFAVLDKSGILKAVLGRIVKKFGSQKYLLLLAITLVFMLLGAFFGIFEEVVPLVPLMIALSYSMGWDALVGLGMSILATNMGFSAAISNPFTIGVAQKLAGLPLFSGTWFRVPVFIAIYALTAFFLVSYARKIDRNPEASYCYGDDQRERDRFKSVSFESNANLTRAGVFLGVIVVLIVLVLVLSSSVAFLSDYALPIVGLLFFFGGVGAGWISGANSKLIGQGLLEGVGGMAPGIPLLLMAASIKLIITNGEVMDTILHSSSGFLQNTSPLASVLIIYALALVIELLISSGSAKALLMIPILLPLAQMAGVTNQLLVTAYCFGDGFSNLAYPTNAVLLISIGLASVSYGKWLKFTWKLWAMVIPATVLFLYIGILIHLGPF